MKFIGKEKSPSGRVTKCTLQFDSVVNPKLMKFPKLFRHSRKKRGTNLVYEMGVDQENRLCLTFASGYFNGRGFRKTTMLKSAIKIMNAVPERILIENPSEMAAWDALIDLIDKPHILQIVDQDKFSKQSLIEIQRRFETSYEHCYAFMKVFDKEVNIMKSKLESLKKETK